MKNKQMMIVFALVLPCLTMAQDQINWEHIQCSAEDYVRYVPLAERSILARFEASWPTEETREVFLCVDGGSCSSLGEKSGGDQLITLPYPYETPMPTGAYETVHVFTLMAGENGMTSTDMAVRTEPTPPLLVNMNVNNDTNVTVYTYSTIVNEGNTGWGATSLICEGSLSVTTTITNNEGDILYQETNPITPGETTFISTEFEYTGPYTQLCAESKMEISGSGFPSELIAQGNQVCQMAGETDKPSIAWKPWGCENIEPVYYISVGNRSSLVRFTAFWPEDETHEVRKCFSDGSCESIGEISGGDHMINVEFTDQLSPGYWRSYHVGLQMIEDPDVLTELIFITTEPTPPIEVSMEDLEASEGDYITLHSVSETLLGTGWGGIAGECSLHKTYLVNEIFEGETLVFRDSILCNTESVSPPVHDLTSTFFYEGEKLELCGRSYMIKIDASPQPTFERQIISTQEGDCVTVGTTITTNYSEELSEDNFVKVYPNPCKDSFSISNNTSKGWFVTNALGEFVTQGKESIVETSSWSSGIYLLTLSSGQHVRVVRE